MLLLQVVGDVVLGLISWCYPATEVADGEVGYVGHVMQRLRPLLHSIGIGEKAITRAAFDEGLPLIVLLDNGLAPCRNPRASASAPAPKAVSSSSPPFPTTTSASSSPAPSARS